MAQLFSKLGIVTHVCDPNTSQTVRQDCHCQFLDSLDYIVDFRLAGLHSDALSKKNQNKQKRHLLTHLTIKIALMTEH